jgi:hypothetical protein
MSEKLTFAERVATMQDAAERLRDVLEIIEDEAEAMAQAQTRFAAKKQSKSAK